MNHGFDSRLWTPWAERSTIAGASMPGVYLIARFDSAAPKIVDPVHPSIVYIGETSDQTIGERLAQFDKSAFTGLRSHSGGRTFHAMHSLAETPPWLFVTSVDLDAAAPLASVFIKHVERLLLWNYAHANGRLPLCNKS